MKNKIERVCIVGSIYALLVYLLNSTVDEMEKTFYFFSYGIPESIQKKIKNKQHFDLKKNKYLNNKFVLLILLRFGQYFRWPFFKKSQIYAQDHLLISSYLIGYKKYIEIEDFPKFYERYFVRKTRLLRLKFWRDDKYKLRWLWKCLVSPSFGYVDGHNDICTTLLLTDSSYIPKALKSKNIITNPLRKLWFNSSDVKKSRILNIYNLDNNDISEICSKKKILFTQPFSDDNFISINEQRRIYKEILKNYDSSEIIIKVHPRDTFDYIEDFPKVVVFNKPIPFQLFDLLNVKFDTAITVCSTAVNSIEYDVKIDWYGTKISNQLVSRIGNL